MKSATTWLPRDAEESKGWRSDEHAIAGTTASRAANSHRRLRLAKRVRVVFCIDGMGIGGTELNALRTAERLDTSRFHVSVICLRPQGPLLSRYRELGIDVLAFPMQRLHGLTALRQGMRLARHLRAEDVDIVHSHDIYNNIFATLWARVARRPVVIASRRWWDDMPRKSLGVVNRYAYRFADCVIANSARVADLLITDDGVRADRVATVPNFVDETAFAPLTHAQRAQLFAELEIPSASIVIGCIAGLRPVKDHETLIKAIVSLRPRWPMLQLVLVGDGEARASLEQLVGQLELTDVVRFAGARPNEPNLHRLFDVSVLSSVSEAFPNTILEAMAAGRPVVATRVGGVMDAVLEGETGLLVPARAAADLATAIEHLLLQPGLRRAMGQAAQRRAREKFHATSVLLTLESLYDRLLRSRAE